jgi:hypothetical protein
MFNSIKKRAKGFWNRNKHRSNEVVRKALYTVETVSTMIQSPPRTPTNTRTLNGLFVDPALPSPPCKAGSDLSMIEVQKVLETVYPNYTALRDNEDTLEHEKYNKLAYAVGKDFFRKLLESNNAGSFKSIPFSQECANAIINKDTPIGMRYHVMYSTNFEYDGSWTLEQNEIEQENRIHTYKHHVDESLLPYVLDYRVSHSDRLYEVFQDPEHVNMEPFYRVQQQGNCYAHAAIVLHFYLQLFYDPSLTASTANLVNLSRFIRNMYNGVQLFNYIVLNLGNTFQSVLNKLMPNAEGNLHEDLGHMPFHLFVRFLTERGPAIASMSVGPDFHAEYVWKYEGSRSAYDSKESEDHAMLLVGIIKSGEDSDIAKGTDVHFILQNFWDNKQFVAVRRDYFLQCRLEKGERSPTFHWVDSQPVFAEPEAIYAHPAGDARVASSSALLERHLDGELFG